MGSPFLSLLSGITSAAGDEFSKQAEEKRKNTARGNELTADAIQKELENNPNLDQSSHEALSRQLYTLRGVPKQAQESLIAAHNRLFQDYARHNSKESGSLPDIPQTTPDVVSGGGGAGGGEGPPQVTTPGVALPPAGGLPPLPNPGYSANPTIGDINFQASRPRTLQAEQDKYTALRQAQRTALSGEIEDKIDLLKKVEADSNIPESDKQYYRALLGANKGLATGGKSVILPGSMHGDMVIDALKRQGEDTSGYNPNSSYKVSLSPDRTKIVSAYETERQTMQGRAALGHNYIKVFPTDQLGNPTVEDELYFPIMARQGGQVIGILPEAALGSQSVQSKFQSVQMKDGSTALVPVTDVTTTGKVANGVPVNNGAAGAVPGQAPGAAALPPVPTGPAPGPGPQASAQPPAQAQASPSVTPPESRPAPGTPAPKTRAVSPGRASVGSPIPIAGSGKAFTPKEVEDNQKLYQATATTADRVKQLIDNIGVLKSLSSAGKIAVALDGSPVFSRFSGMTPKQEKVAALFTSLREDINTLRSVYQATGFRGPEAFSALTGLAGKPLSDPKLTEEVLKQTLESLDTQKGVIEGAFKDHNLPVPEFKSKATPTKGLDEIFR